VKEIKGHTTEVTDVQWNSTDFNRIATTSDDGTARVWYIDAPSCSIGNKRVSQQGFTLPPTYDPTLIYADWYSNLPLTPDELNCIRENVKIASNETTPSMNKENSDLNAIDSPSGIIDFGIIIYAL
jgi:WD40 repeat protein